MNPWPFGHRASRRSSRGSVNFSWELDSPFETWARFIPRNIFFFSNPFPSPSRKEIRFFSPLPRGRLPRAQRERIIVRDIGLNRAWNISISHTRPGISMQRFRKGKNLKLVIFAEVEKVRVYIPSKEWGQWLKDEGWKYTRTRKLNGKSFLDCHK